MALQVMELQTDKIYAFVREEVTRQGYDVSDLEGFNRLCGMLGGWCYALTCPTKYPSLRNITAIAFYIEPRKNNIEEFRNCNVTVGGRRCPDHKEVSVLMDEWHAKLPKYSPDEAYYAFQLIHPFQDGNGRTGKIIHNWLLDSLDNPVLVKDFFGGGIP